MIIKDLTSSVFKWSCIIHDDSIATCLQIIQALSMIHAMYYNKVSFLSLLKKRPIFYMKRGRHLETFKREILLII